MRALALIPLISIFALCYWLLRSLPGPAVFRVITSLALILVIACGVAVFILHGRFVLPYWLSMLLCFGSTLFSLLLIFQLTRAVLLIPAGLTALVWKTPLQVLLSGSTTIFILGFSVVLCLVGFGNAAKVPDVKRINIEVADLPEALHGLRLVQLSDLHLGTIYDHNWARQVVDQTNALNADLIVVTGDCGEFAPAVILAALQPLRDLRAPLGVYYALGNHEYYQGLPDWLAWYSESGQLLRDRHVLLEKNGAQLVLAGVDDQKPDLAGAFAEAPEVLPRILLAHRPGLAKQAAALGIDLMLAGHTHGGMLPLLRDVVARANGGAVSGRYQVDEMTLYVSNGTGLWTYMAMRILTPGEITEITLQGPPRI